LDKPFDKLKAFQSNQPMAVSSSNRLEAFQTRDLMAVSPVEPAQGPEPVEGQPQMDSIAVPTRSAADPALSVSKGCRSHFRRRARRPRSQGQINSR
ncbi:MAG: hypothetical protein Q7S40_04270, partial [Opitutaceae bacterium]|nr:hypothetical protein [Opitutaceae bacterium]